MKLSSVLILGATLVSAGCANLYTIDRTTTFGPAAKEHADGGKVIHLDARQRLFIANNMGTFCAEPSPDAMASFASALSAGGSAPSAGAISAAFGGSSDSASIGLRTQSITLMRDALYRMCEAYANGNLSRAQVMSLLGRSQDLTAVILAVEQLTGVVAANQAALVKHTEADASAVLIANSKLLAQARKDQARAQERVDEAVIDVGRAEAETLDAETALTEAQSLPAGPERDAAVRRRTAERDNAKIREGTAKEILALRKKTLADAEQLVQDISKNQDSASTRASAATAGAAQFSVPAQVKELDSEASVQIAKSVETMVTAVLGKSYASDYCLAILEEEKAGAQGHSAKVIATCRTLVLRVAEAEIERFGGILDNSFGADNSSDCIEKWVTAGAANRQELKNWLSDNAGGVNVPAFLLKSGFTEMRQDAIGELGISCS